MAKNSFVMEATFDSARLKKDQHLGDFQVFSVVLRI